MRPTAALLLALALVLPTRVAAQAPLSDRAAALYQQAIDTGRFFARCAALSPQVEPTADGRSFVLVWKATAAAPKHWIVSLHGAGRPARGFATDDLVVWHPHLVGRDVGLVCLQWWLGTGDAASDFFTPAEITAEVDRVLRANKVAPGGAVLAGFSRGAANTYAVAAIDSGTGGKRYFSYVIASSGGVALDYPPTRAILAGDHGERPLAGTQWITAAGARDPHADRDGIEGMRRTGAWLRDQGAVVVLAIEDPEHGHGALHTNAANVKRVLDLILR